MPFANLKNITTKNRKWGKAAVATHYQRPERKGIRDRLRR